MTIAAQLSPQLTCRGETSDAMRVRSALVESGLETPLRETGLTRDEKYTRILASMTDVVATLGLDLDDDSLRETPHRIAKMYVDELKRQVAKMLPTQRRGSPWS